MPDVAFGSDDAGARPMTIEESAPAKLNLSLRIVGRRPDGYHEIESLVAFADIGDRLSVEPGPSPTLNTDGEFAPAIDGGNLVMRAVEQVLSVCPQATSGTFRLVKQLPVAAGLGGGSSDAAAALRLLLRLNADRLDRHKVLPIAHGLGADVAMCLTARPSIVRGIGTEVTPLRRFPAVPAVLVNPRVALSTPAVYEALDAAPVPDGYHGSVAAPDISSLDDLVRFMGANGNDLQAPALRLAPVVGDVLERLNGTPRCLAAAMSGSGATCFGIFEDEARANDAKARIARAEPDWWVQKTILS